MVGCELSLVLPVHDDQENLDRILGELQNNQPDPKWEVLVVDDGSPQPLTLSTEAPEQWQVVRLETQSGAAVARNAGVKKARGEHIVLLSVFLKIPPDYISRVETFIKDYQFDFAQHLLKKAPEISATHFQRFLANQSRRVSDSSENLSIKQSLFTAAIIKKESFCKLKGFDESMQHYGGHEMDLIYRLDRAGYTKRMIIPELSLERIKLESHTRTRQRLQEYGKTGLPNLLKKHPELKAEILTRPLLWRVLAILGLTGFTENRILKKIEVDRKLPGMTYRLYLHLIVRNAWDAR